MVKEYMLDEASHAALENELREAREMPANYGIHLSDKEWRKWSFYYKREYDRIYKTRFPDRACMEAMGIERDIEQVFQRIDMGAFLEKQPKTNFALTMEFLLTLKVIRNMNKFPTSIKFRLNGEKFRLTTAQLNEIFETPVDPCGDKFALNRKFKVKEFWKEITTSSIGYFARNAKATLIRNPVVRYLEKILSNTIFARSEGGSVNKEELYVIWCFIYGVKFDVAAYIINTFERIRTKGAVKVFVGGYVTLIAEHLGVDTTELQFVKGENLDINAMKKMNVLVEVGGIVWCEMWKDKKVKDESFPLPNSKLTTILGKKSLLKTNLHLKSHAHIAERERVKKRLVKGGINVEEAFEEAENENEELRGDEIAVIENGDEEMQGEESEDGSDDEEVHVSRKEWKKYTKRVDDIYDWVKALYQKSFPPSPPPA